MPEEERDEAIRTKILARMERDAEYYPFTLSLPRPLKVINNGLPPSYLESESLLNELTEANFSVTPASYMRERFDSSAEEVRVLLPGSIRCLIKFVGAEEE